MSVLLDEIEAGALDPGTDLPTVLRKCVALGGHSGSTALREWATRELKGYADGQELPPYRLVPASIQIDGFIPGGHISGQTIAPSALPSPVDERIIEVVPIHQPIAEIASLAAAGDVVRLSLPSASSIVTLMNHRNRQRGELSHIERIYWAVAATSLVGLVDTVRTNLTELVAEMRSGLLNPSAEPSSALADQAVSIVINGSGNRVTGITLDKSQESRSKLDESIPRRVMYWLVGAATLIAAITGILLLWHPWSH